MTADPPPPRLWLGINKWAVRGDGVLEPFCVYTLDASREAVGFYPFGYGLPGMMEEQARALCDLLNVAADRATPYSTPRERAQAGHTYEYDLAAWEAGGRVGAPPVADVRLKPVADRATPREQP